MAERPAQIGGLADQGRPIAVGEPATFCARRPRRDLDRARRGAGQPVHEHALRGHAAAGDGGRDGAARSDHGAQRSDSAHRCGAQRSDGAHRRGPTGRLPIECAQHDGPGTAGARGRPGLPRRALTAPPGRASARPCSAPAMTGYQETLTDPSYHGQIVVATAPQIGNTGWNDEDDESGRIQVAGYVVRDPSRRRRAGARAGRWTTRSSRQGIVGVPAIDTRALVRHLRERGAMRAGVFSGARAGRPDAELVDRVRSGPAMEGADLYGAVTTPREYVVGRAAGERRFRVAALDVGIKSNTPRMFAARGVETHVLPADTPIERIEELAPRRVLPVQRPRRPGDRRRARRADPAGAGAADPAVRHLLRQPDPRPGAGARHVQAALRPPRHQHPGGRARHRQGLDHRAEPRVRRRGRGGGAVRHPVRPAEITHTCPNDGCVEGLRCVGRARRSACSTTPRPRRARTTPPTCSTGSCDLMETEGPADAPPRRHPARAGDRLRPDRHRPGLPSSTTPAPRPAACCAPRACASRWSTPTRRRS